MINATRFAQPVIQRQSVVPVTDMRRNHTARIQIAIIVLIHQNQLIRVKKPADGSGTQKVKNGLVANVPAVMAHHALVSTAMAAHITARVAAVNVFKHLLAAIVAAAVVAAAVVAVAAVAVAAQVLNALAALITRQIRDTDTLAPVQPEADTAAIKRLRIKTAGWIYPRFFCLIIWPCVILRSA